MSDYECDEDDFEMEDDEGYPDDPVVVNEAPSHRVITAESLRAAQQHDLQTVADMLDVNIEHARIVLIHYRWNVDQLSNDFGEHGREKLFSKVGLVVVDSRHAPLPPLSGIVTCGVCFDDVPSDDATQMECSHVFCNDCWLENFRVQIKDGQSRRLFCMAHKCTAICDEHKVRGVLRSRDKPALDRYDLSLLESYIEDNAKVKWCPSVPHCGNAVRIEGEPYCEVECVCSQQFCFSCTREPHSPCSCNMWQQWKQKIDESNSHYMSSYTKPCPKCFKPVEKDLGCNLMTCRCGQHFCWVCGAATQSAHDSQRIYNHECGRYKEVYEKKHETSTKFLARYNHYYSHWQAHLDSLKLEAKQREIIRLKVDKLEQSDLVVKDYGWLVRGLQMLSKARRSLSYSYVFAYFMFGGELFKDDFSPEKNIMNQNLFEDQQQEFEREVEKLSKLLELPIERIESDVAGVRYQLVSSTSIIDKLCARLYDMIENDLLEHVFTSTHHIAPYSSHVDRASHLEQEEECMKKRPLLDSSENIDGRKNIKAAGVAATVDADVVWLGPKQSDGESCSAKR